MQKRERRYDDPSDGATGPAAWPPQQSEAAPDWQKSGPLGH